jgi:hypothetical protein
MFVYNITTKVNRDIINDWLKWQKEENIPEMMSSELFTGYKFFQLLEQDDSEGATYVVQFFSETEENYKRYIDEFAPRLRENTFKKWGDQFVAFRSLMRVV